MDAATFGECLGGDASDLPIGEDFGEDGEEIFVVLPLPLDRDDDGSVAGLEVHVAAVEG